ncbi:hypothetical protein AC249_AIPGENE4441 [Exaiptasia diaphana]|nr:hypothetical protein AC249_AIPGENE4441 [Exaiptasia diaphana]
MDCKHVSYEDGGSGESADEWKPRQRSASTLSDQLLEEYAKTEESNETFKKKYDEAHKNVFGSKSNEHYDHSPLSLNDKNKTYGCTQLFYEENLFN